MVVCNSFLFIFVYQFDGRIVLNQTLFIMLPTPHHLNFTVDIDGEIKITHQTGGKNLTLIEVEKFYRMLGKHPKFSESEYENTDVEVIFVDNKPFDVKVTVRELVEETYSITMS